MEKERSSEMWLLELERPEWINGVDSAAPRSGATEVKKQGREQGRERHDKNFQLEILMVRNDPRQNISKISQKVGSAYQLCFS